MLTRTDAALSFGMGPRLSAEVVNTGSETPLSIWLQYGRGHLNAERFSGNHVQQYLA